MSGVAPALAVQGLSYAYGSGGKALDDISFSLEAGRFTALLGSNGAGKTTLMAMITRLFQSPGGKIEICGHDLIKDNRKALASIGVVFQRPTLDLDLTVEQNLTYAASLYGLDRKSTKKRIQSQLEQLDMQDRLKAKVRTLSGGMRRRVELARALLHQPKLLVLDEPTVGLDVDSRKSITDHAHRLCADQAISVLWTTHLIDEIRDGDNVVMLKQGRIEAMGPIDALLGETATSSLAEAYAKVFAKPKVADS